MISMCYQWNKIVAAALLLYSLLPNTMVNVRKLLCFIIVGFAYFVQLTEIGILFSPLSTFKKKKQELVDIQFVTNPFKLSLLLYEYMTELSLS